ncbi:MAG: hypothetical protein HC814_08385 [Rhodobacteraceae bacterium]|nr:hypothetical protein [Paracoccaceae bacterium]
MDALRTAFLTNGVTAEIRIGETGWPTAGSQPAQPHASIANVTYARWYYNAMSAFFGSTTKGFLFEAYDEPWKGNQGATSSEGFFGAWKAEGTASSVSDYMLIDEKAKYAMSQKAPPSGCLSFFSKKK